MSLFSRTRWYEATSPTVETTLADLTGVSTQPRSEPPTFTALEFSDHPPPRNRHARRAAAARRRR